MASGRVKEYHWKQVDELELGTFRPYLEDGDECYYLMPLPNTQDFGDQPVWKSSAWQKIINLKHSPERQKENLAFAGYKAQAIEQFAHDIAIFLDKNKPILSGKKVALIPIPPSKAIDDPNYDDRMSVVCQTAVNLCNTPDVKYVECLRTKESRPSASKSGERLTPEQIKRNLEIDKDAICGYEIVFVADDVLTQGTDYAACKQLIMECCPDARIIGLFWTFAQRPSVEDDSLE